MAAAVAQARSGQRRAHLSGVDRARPGPAHGRGAPLGHRLRPRAGPSPCDADLDEVVGTWPAGRRAGRLARPGLCRPRGGADGRRPTTCECWTFLPAPSPRAMWARRQAHETAIHRVDAQLAAGLPVSPWSPGLCRRRHRRAPVAVRPPAQHRAARRSAGHLGGALRRCRRRVGAAPGRARRHHDARHGQRPGRRALHGDRTGRRSLPGAVEPRRCGRPERRRRALRAGPVLRGRADPLVLGGRPAARHAVGVVPRRRPKVQ